MVTTITEAKYLKELKLEDLIGSLKAHKEIIQEDKPQKKGKIIALKIVQYDGSSIQKEEILTGKEKHELNEHPQKEDKDEVSLISIKIQRIIRRRDQN